MGRIHDDSEAELEFRPAQMSAQINTPLPEKRLYSLDALRGIAALSVVVWHWQHFYAIGGTWPVGWQRSAEPFYPLLKPLYDQGWVAVDLFFAISGYVFFWLYADAIANRRIGPGKFALLRFSRLYPLHFVTLVAVAAMQLLFRQQTGKFFIFAANDWRHFASSLVLAQQWLPPDELQSFNGPAWSISIEALLYAIFFAGVRLGLRNPGGTFALAVASGVLLYWDGQIARGLMGFFMGGTVYYIARELAAHRRAREIAACLVAAALLVCTIVILEIYLGPIQWLMQRAPAPLAHAFAAKEYDVFLLAFIFVVSPLVLGALALHEQVLGGRYKRLSFLGDISYSTYMLHFPMQLALALIALRFGLTSAVFETGFAMIAFYAALILLGALSYNYFERPLQAGIRDTAKTVLSPAQ
jgi:peptidoglycan/LPS O-acetylase OafA/YrhL